MLCCHLSHALSSLESRWFLATSLTCWPGWYFLQEEQVRHPHGEAVNDAEHTEQPDGNTGQAEGGTGEPPAAVPVVKRALSCVDLGMQPKALCWAETNGIFLYFTQ